MILDHLAPGFEEVAHPGGINYVVPHRLFPAGYHCDPKQPLPFACLASQKGHMALYLMHLYLDPEETERFRSSFAGTGKRLDMGASCVRFKSLDALPLGVIAETLGRTTVSSYVSAYVASRGGVGGGVEGSGRPVRAKKARAGSGDARKTKPAPARAAGKAVKKRVSKVSAAGGRSSKPSSSRAKARATSRPGRAG